MFIIKELLLNGEYDGIRAISLVDEPAIEEDFFYFNKEVKMGRLKDKEIEPGVRLRDYYQYTAHPAPEKIDTSHEFCIQRAGKVYHISEINSWGGKSTSDRKNYGFNMDSNFFTTFQGNTGSFNINQQIYNCRHWFRRVNSINEIPKYKQNMFKETPKQDFKVEFKVSNEEKREIQGLALQSGQFIYRTDINGLGEGYVFFSRDTVRKLKERYGFNRTITIQHEADITGTAILLDSWLEDDDEDNRTQWFLRYKILNDKLWEGIKEGLVRGYSIEGLFDVK